MKDVFNMNDQLDKRKNWHQALTTPQSVRIRKVHAAIGRAILGLFERFEAGFLQELHIDEAIADYEKIAQTFVIWKMKHPDANVPEQKEVLSRMKQRGLR
jgi:phosphoglycolate phosphatase-like HAD superfamily hydrolase